MTKRKHSRKLKDGESFSAVLVTQFSKTSTLLISATLASSLLSVSCASPREMDCKFPIAEVSISCRAPEKSNAGSVDLFFFNDDELGRLDSYQRVDSLDGNVIQASSREGKKRLVVLANTSKDKYTWSDISCYETLTKATYSLDKESPDSPVMSGETLLSAGADKSCSVKLEPLMAEVVLRSIKCDFSGRPYSNAKLENIKVYLTNVNSRCKLYTDSLYLPEGILNVGGLNESDVATLTHPEMIFREIEEPVGMGSIRPYLRFYCYPNEAAEESLGSPFTKLVVEGTVNGKVTYYPVCVGRDIEGKGGISRNKSYLIDLKITRLGSEDPETPVMEGSVVVVAEVADWREKDKEIISY